MIATIYSIGYSIREDQQRLIEIMNADPRAIIIDTRKSPVSRIEGWNESELRKAWHNRYQWLGMTLGNVNYKPEDRSKGIQLVDEETGIRTLINGLKYDHSIILLCGCQDACTCHRTYIAKALIRALRGQPIPWDVDEAALKAMITEDNRSAFMEIAFQERAARDSGDELEAEGLRLQALELLVAKEIKIPELWSDEAVELLKKRGTPEQLQEYKNCLEWAEENAEGGDPFTAEAYMYEAEKILKQVAGAA